MLQKSPKSLFSKWLKIGGLSLIVAEGVCFIVSYQIWSKVNTEREYRKYLRDNYPSLLELYYKTGEILNSESQVRVTDSAYWSHKK